MLSVFLLVINSVRYALPIITLYGSAPTYFSFWILLRTITFTFCPTHIYRLCDDRFYSMYQRFALFFFQNWVQTKVCLTTLSNSDRNRSHIIRWGVHESDQSKKSYGNSDCRSTSGFYFLI
jgi:hypothetical protein